MSQQPAFFTVAEAAFAWNVSPAWVTEKLRRKAIRGVRQPRAQKGTLRGKAKWLIPAAEVERVHQERHQAGKV